MGFAFFHGKPVALHSGVLDSRLRIVIVFGVLMRGGRNDNANGVRCGNDFGAWSGAGSGRLHHDV
jgi:hypothetical protein